MKSIVTILAATLLCSGASIQSFEPIRMVKDFSPLTPITVTLTQDGNVSGPITFYRNTDGKRTVSYNPDGGLITITTEMKMKDNPPKYEFYDIEPKHLAHKEILIEKNKNNPVFYDIRFKRVHQKKSSMTKKQMIQAYKPNVLDQQEDWTVVILDDQGEKISEAKFKEMTKKLHLQLNQPAVDKDNVNARYNTNTIGGSSKKMMLPPLTITADSFLTDKFTPGSSIQITEGSIDIVDKDGKSVLKAASPRVEQRVPVEEVS